MADGAADDAARAVSAQITSGLDYIRRTYYGREWRSSYAVLSAVHKRKRRAMLVRLYARA